jgi:hypothetical protein
MRIADRTKAAIEEQRMTGWGVLGGGTHIGLAFLWPNGSTSSVALSVDTVSSLLMTLPRMLQSALDARFPDGSLRVVQRLERWKLERNAANDSLILVLGTSDGFEVAFSVDRQDADVLGAELHSIPSVREPADAARLV